MTAGKSSGQSEREPVTGAEMRVLAEKGEYLWLFKHSAEHPGSIFVNVPSSRSGDYYCCYLLFLFNIQS